MKKTLLYILILCAVGAGVWFVMFRESSMFSIKDTGFTIRDTSAIGKIFLATNNNETVKLQRTPKGWIVNDKYRARKATMELLMQALQYQEAQTPVSEQMHNNIVKSLQGGSVKVEIYNRAGEKMRTFYVGGETGSGSGTYMLMEGGTRPYVVQIPGFTGYLTPRYLPDLKNWRDRTVFEIEPEEVSTIHVAYPNEPLNNFTVTQDGDKVNVAIDPALTEGKTLNKGRALDFIKFFKLASAEQVMNGLGGVRENMVGMPHVCTITVKGKNGYEQDVVFYATPLSRRSKNLVAEDEIAAKDMYDSDHLYAIANHSKDTFVVQKLNFGRFFRLGYEFYVQDAPPQNAAIPAGTH